MEHDFTHLYTQLGLPPGCSLAQLKHAYRRRVAELHPDRAHGADAGDDTGELARLITLYKQALRFHARHGRLPGADAVAPGPTAGRRNAASHSATASSMPPAHTDAAPRARRGWLMVALLLLATGVMWSMLEDTGAPASDAMVEAEVEASSSSEPQVDHLVIGMDADDVLQLQGTPTLQGASVWEYGPSWVRFEDDHLVEWYSSPLYRLKTRETRVGAP